MLAVQAEFLARAHGIEVPVPLFKVCGKIFHAVFFSSSAPVSLSAAAFLRGETESVVAK